MRVDFYLLSHGDANGAAALLARKSVEAGHRVVLVADGEERLQALSHSLWQDHPEAFLAHGLAGGDDDARQPILLAGQVDTANEADCLLLADGQWRDPPGQIERTLLLLDNETRAAARSCWTMLGQRDGVERNFWKQDEAGRWVKGP